MKNMIDNLLKMLEKDKVFLISMLVLIIVACVSFYYVSHNNDSYDQTIAEIISLKETKDYNSTDFMGNTETLYKQDMIGLITNGEFKGKKITLKNSVSYSQAYDDHFQIGDEVFISVPKGYDGNIKTNAQIDGVKRDKYIIGVSLLFMFIIILIGRFKGFKSLVSLLVNIGLFMIAINLYLSGWNLFVLMGIASLMFIVLSILISNGYNKKGIAGILSTIVSVIVSFTIALIVIAITNSQGIRYEEMEFITKPADQIFMIEILIGTIGAIMDIAISISSSIQELYDHNPKVTRKELMSSSKEIGNDIMSTMTNTLLFAYISGSIPFILLWLKNGLSISYVVGVDLSLEIIRALTGSIGIVLSIPISMYIAIWLFKKTKAGDK
jgi:uncharacterized membrane protein